MKGTGIFVTPEELKHVQIAYNTSGMILNNGEPLGRPAYEVYLLTKKYNPPANAGLNMKTGEFCVE